MLLDSIDIHDRLLFLNQRHTLPFNDFILVKYIIDTRAYNLYDPLLKTSIKYLVPGGDFINHQDN